MEPVSTREAASKANSEVNRALSVHFMEGIEMAYFRAHFHIGRLHVRQFLRWNMSSSSILKKITNEMRSMASTRSKPLNGRHLDCYPHPNLQEIGTEQVRLGLRASLAVAI